MTRNTLLTVVILLSLAILGVLGFKLSPMLRPLADLSLAVTYCDPGLQTCTATLPEGGRLEFSIDPQPIRPLQTLHLSVAIHGLNVEKVDIDFDGTQMKMGYNRASLSGSQGRFTGQAMLPVCITGSMEWAATILISSGNRRIAVPFHFAVAGR